jgi:hypothetical protein
MAKFPKDLADVVFLRWNELVAGEYEAPRCPTKALLRKILEACYLAACAPEEARYPAFNVLVTPELADHDLRDVLNIYKFDKKRPVTIDELRRLAPATDSKKSAIWITFNDNEIFVSGMYDLGTSWHRARLGLTYNYHVPSALLVQVDRPGRVKVYQGQYAIASLSNGTLSVHQIDIPLFLHKSVRSGLEKIAESLTEPNLETPRDYEGFWFTALYNVFSAIANSISVSGHGGVLVILEPGASIPPDLLRTKYTCRSSALHDSFVKFINARNLTADYWTASETEAQLEGNAAEAELLLISATDLLVEAVRFVAQMAGCDGAIVITSDLQVLGFGSEIRAEMAEGVVVLQVVDEMRQKYQSCDVEQFGMRHRSAVKLVSKLPTACVLAISQDGPVSAVSSDGNSVLVRKGVPLGNLNIPWA